MKSGRILYFILSGILLFAAYVAFTCIPVHAAELKIECDSYKVTWSQQHEGYPITMTVNRWRGVWMQVPKNDKSTALFVNLDTNEIAEMGKTSGRMYLVIYKNVVAYNKKVNPFSQLCRVAS